MLNLKKVLLALLVSGLITGCGGGGGGGSSVPTYTGVTTPAAITSSNAQDISSKSSEASQEAVTQDNARDANSSNPFTAIGVTMSSGDNNMSEKLVDIGRQILNSLQVKPVTVAAVTYTSSDLNAYGSNMFCGGSITISDNFGANGLLSGTITYSNLCISDIYLGGQFTINGTVTYSETATEISISYRNFSFNDGTTSATLNMTVTCDTSFFSCTVSSDFVGSDGKTYRIADMTVSGSGTGPYSVTATFYHPDHGSVSISGSGIYYDCPDGGPSAGTINITGASGSSASITFTGCNSFSGTWSDGLGSSGSF